MLLCLTSFSSLVSAQAFSPQELTLIEVKMTSSETVVIQNTSSVELNLSNYLVQYFNKHNPASLSVPTDAQQLPDMVLAPKQTILLNSDSAATCGAAAVAELDFTLSDSSGYLMLVKVEPQSDGSFIYRPQDRVNWTSTTSGADLLKVPSATADAKAVWYRKIVDGSWQQAQLGNDCSLLMPAIEPANTPTYLQWATGEEPPATIVSATATSSAESIIPPANIGLPGPVVTELLPNTAQGQTDSEDEFIELYNGGSKPYELSGYILEVGLTTKRVYKIPGGTTIAAKSFKTFFSSDTGLALSNTGSQASLLDPLGNVVSRAADYSSAKDGHSWALANGKWYWSTSPTPSLANVIKQPVAKMSSATKKSTLNKSSAGVVRAASTTNTSGSAGVSSSLDPTGNAPGKVHPLVLAGVGGLALLYAGYEYRHDVANQFYRLRRYRAARREPGPTA